MRAGTSGGEGGGRRRRAERQLARDMRALWAACLLVSAAGAGAEAGAGEARAALAAGGAFSLQSTVLLNSAERRDRELGYRLQAQLGVTRGAGDLLCFTVSTSLARYTLYATFLSFAILCANRLILVVRVVRARSEFVSDCVSDFEITSRGNTGPALVGSRRLTHHGLCVQTPITIHP